MNSFIHIKLLLYYLNEFEEQRNDMKMLGEYVIDNIFEHKGNGTNTHSFDNLSLKEIREWNEIIRYRSELNKNLNDFAEMLLGMLAYSHNLPVGFQINQNNGNNHCRLFYINESQSSYHICNTYYTHWYDYFRQGMLSKEYMEKYGNKRDDIVCMGTDCFTHIYNFISIPRIHEANDYILYFINNDFNLNRLRKLLITLMKEQMKLYSNEIDDEKQIINELEYNELLIEYCRKLIHSCKDYLSKQAKNATIPLTL